VIPDRGDILHIESDPASGREMKGRHYCLVVSRKAFNQRFQLVMACPISGGLAPAARHSGFLVPLSGTGLRTDGNIHVQQLKALDWAARKARLVERAPAEIVAEVLDCLTPVFED
jgi:mRNA interferase ChpB